MSHGPSWLFLLGILSAPADLPETISIPDPLSGGSVELARAEGLWIRGATGEEVRRRDLEPMAREAAGRLSEDLTPAYRGPDGRIWPFRGDEVLVRLRRGAGGADRERVLRTLGASVIRSSRRGDLLALRLPAGRALPGALELLRNEPAVLLAEPRYLAPFDPFSSCRYEDLDDPLLPSQWAARNAGGGCAVAGVDIALPEAWEITCGVPEVVLAILDSGMDLEHPDLAPSLFPRGDDDWNFTLESSRVPADSFGHGTSVAGIAAAAAGNGQGIAGVAPGCRLMPLKVDGIDLVMNLVEALDYLEEFAGLHPELRVVANGSLNAGAGSLAVREAVKRAFEAGVVLCFSAGNGGGAVEQPAALPESIAVGAIAPDGTRKRSGGCGGGEWASSHGPELDLVAPGVLIPATDMRGPGGRAPGDYDPAFGGTSAASPIVAGVAALALSANPRLTPAQVKEVLYATAVDGEGDPLEDLPGFDERMGWGRVHAGRAVALAREMAGLLPGDADCDGVLELEDVLAILAALFGGVPSSCPRNLESNGDGDVDIADAIHVLLRLFGGR